MSNPTIYLINGQVGNNPALDGYTISNDHAPHAPRMLILPRDAAAMHTTSACLQYRLVTHAERRADPNHEGTLVAIHYDLPNWEFLACMDLPGWVVGLGSQSELSPLGGGWVRRQVVAVNGVSRLSYVFAILDIAMIRWTEDGSADPNHHIRRGYQLSLFVRNHGQWVPANVNATLRAYTVNGELRMSGVYADVVPPDDVLARTVWVFIRVSAFLMIRHAGSQLPPSAPLE